MANVSRALRREHGFAIAGASRVIGESRFVRLLAYPGDRDAFDSADQQYDASRELRDE